MRLQRLETSCGIGELGEFGNSGAQTIAEFVAVHCFNDYDDHCGCDCEQCEKCEHGEKKPEYAQIIFTDKSAATSPGARFAAMIRSKRWGTLVATAPTKNPNSNNNIQVWTWTPNKAFYTWAKNQ